MSELTREQLLQVLADMCGNAATGRSVIALRDMVMAHDFEMRRSRDEYKAWHDGLHRLMGEGP